MKSKSGGFVTIDVKAVHGAKPKPERKTQATWNMPKVAERGSTPKFFYVLVWLGEKRGDYANPEYFVMTAAWAANRCEDQFKAYIDEKSTRDAKSKMRRLSYSEVQEWRDRWELLEAQ